MSKNNVMPRIAMGAWSWGAGAAGGDQVFGQHLIANDLKPVFDKAMELGLNLWDTAAVYGEGSSERILGNFVKNAGPENVILSTKFTPQIADGKRDPPCRTHRTWAADCPRPATKRPYCRR